MMALTAVALAAMTIKTMLQEDNVQPLAILPQTLRHHRLTVTEAAYLNGRGGGGLFKEGDAIQEALVARGYVPGDILDGGAFRRWERELQGMPGRRKAHSERIQARIDKIEEMVEGLDERIDAAVESDRDTVELEARRKALEDEMRRLEDELEPLTMLTDTRDKWGKPFSFRGLQFREGVGGTGLQVFHGGKWHDISGLNWRTSREYYSHQVSIELWGGEFGKRSVGSIRFPEPPFQDGTKR